MRIRTSLVVIAACAATLLSACGGGKSPTKPVDTSSTTGYRNPVLDQDFPDPSVLRVSGTYWAYATQTFLGNGQRINIQMASSPDLVHWTYKSDALPTKPAWAQVVWNFWAPHVIYAAEQNRYLMYFSADSTTNPARDGTNMCIGIATSQAPDGPFTDVGAPLVCSHDFVHIDPMAFDDVASGKHYLYWGSNSAPISVQELAADRVHFAAGSSPTPVIRPSAAPYESLVEGPWVIKRPDFYYMFYSGNDCCSLPNPHYAVLVARASSPTGPFQKLGDASGTGNSTILTGGDYFLGPGHNAIITDGKGDDWIVYHAVDPNNPKLSDNRSVRRPMLIDRLKYDANGWPYVEGGHPSHGNATPPTP